MTVYKDIPDEVLLRRYWLAHALAQPGTSCAPSRSHPGTHTEIPDIRMHAVRNLRWKGLCFPFRKEFQKRQRMDLRCFYTGSMLYLAEGDLHDHLGFDIIPWAVTREHLCAKWNNDPSSYESIGNIVPAAMFMNNMATHMPLCVKLYDRDTIRTLEFDREAMDFDTFVHVRHSVIAGERAFWFEGNYPWFPTAVFSSVDPAKDVDGFHPENAGRLAIGSPGLRPCTPMGVMRLLSETEIVLEGARVLVVGTSAIVGRPLSTLLSHSLATVTMAHAATRDLPWEVARADVVVVAAGYPGLVRGSHLKPGAVVIDVGINRLTDGSVGR